MDLENAEEILQILERYTKQKSKTIPDELNSYLNHVALTGDSVYSWSKVQYFFREKLAHVLKDFHDTTPRTEDLPISRNVDAFNYDTMKTALLERFDLFNAAPFTIQRLSELLNEPKKHYCRLDKFMRALEKNILVVSTVEPGHRTMGSENGDSMNGDPLMDINVDVEMDKEPSSSSVPLTDKQSIEAQSESHTEETSTPNKTEQGTSEQCEELSDDANVNTNGHHNDELNDTIEDIKDDEDTAESSDKTDSSSSSEEIITVEVQSAEHEEKVNSPEITVDVNEPNLETAPATSSDTDPSKETLPETEQKSDNKETSEAESSAELKADVSETTVEKTSENISEGKHLLDREGDDEDCEPTAAKLVKLDETLASVEPVSGSVQVEADGNDQTDQILPEKAVSVEQPSEVKETLPEAVLEEDSTLQAAPLDQPIVGETPGESADDVKSTIVDSQVNVVAKTAVPADGQAVPQPDTIDDSKNDTVSTDNTISPLASTISNDLDILEDEDEQIEPIIADGEPNILEPSTAAETDVEMTPSVENAEQMAVEDPTPILSSTNSDLAMDATQIIPTTSDEQMDVLESNSMDQDL